MKEGWVETTVEKLVNQKIIEKPLDGNHGEIHPKKSDFTASGIPFIMASDLVKGVVNQETCNFINREQASSLRKGFAKNGDVLLSHKGTIGRSAILHTFLDYVVLTPQVTYYRILDNSVLDNRFLYYSFHSPKFQNEIKRIAGAGSTRAYIGITQQLQLHIPIAPLAEQKRIVAILDEAFKGIDKVIANTEKNLANSRELFESYLKAIFTQKGDGWVEKKLGDIATFRNGLNFTKSSRGESIKIVGVKDFQNHFWIQEDQLDVVTIDGDLKEVDMLRKGDILTVRSNGNKELIGRCILAGDISEKTSHSGFTIRIRIESENIYPQFIVYSLKSRHFRKQLVEGGGGISISSLNQKGLS